MLISSSDQTLVNTFEGYAFVGIDFVHGREGLHEYQRATGQTIGPGHDGCYVSGSRDGGKYTLGTDSRGMGKLFVYRRRDQWVIGDSLHDLVQYLRSNGHRLTPLPEMLGHLAVNNTFSTQMVSADTPFAEIELLPSKAQVIIEDGALRVDLPAPEPAISYEEALHEYLTTWRSRATTLLRDERVRFAADLSGGLDSRLMVAFLHSTGDFNTENPRFRMVSNRNFAADYTAASGVARHLGLELNQGRKISEPVRSGNLALERWRSHSLGVYLPVYLAGATFSPFDIQGHGAGGGNHRRYYDEPSIHDRMRRFTSRIQPAPFKRWSRSIESSLQAAGATHRDVDPMIVHYREYRGRFHFGHRPHYRTMFMPLSTGLLDRMTDQHDDRGDRQFYYDIMESLVPGLMDMPYDKNEKLPTETERRHLTTVALDKDIAVGKVYGEPDPPTVEYDEVSAFSEWVADAAVALKRPEVRKHIGAKQVRQRDEALAYLLKSGKLPASNHHTAISLSYVHAVDFALPSRA